MSPRRTLLASAILLSSLHSALAAPRFHHGKGDLGEVLARMNDAGKRLRTITANLTYTTVTVLVNDQSTEYGEFFLRNPRRPEILIHFEKPDPKMILFKKDKAEIYLPKINRIEQYDLAKRSGLVQQFLLLGFGTETEDLKKSYRVALEGDEELQGEAAAVLELTPKDPAVAAQLTKVEIWVSEGSWLPIQQKFSEPGGDYLVARYTDLKMNLEIPSSKFDIRAEGARRVKM